MTIQSEKGRSREGAWIEMGEIPKASYIKACRSREGAWIEILLR